jgi:hypothetical protein
MRGGRTGTAVLGGAPSPLSRRGPGAGAWVRTMRVLQCRARGGAPTRPPGVGGAGHRRPRHPADPGRAGRAIGPDRTPPTVPSAPERATPTAPDDRVTTVPSRTAPHRRVHPRPCHPASWPGPRQHTGPDLSRPRRTDDRAGVAGARPTDELIGGQPAEEKAPLDDERDPKMTPIDENISMAPRSECFIRRPRRLVRTLRNLIYLQARRIHPHMSLLPGWHTHLAIGHGRRRIAPRRVSCRRGRRSPNDSVAGSGGAVSSNRMGAPKAGCR